MDRFSLIEQQMGAFEEKAAHRRALEPAPPWPASERSEAKRKARVAKSCKDFWFFDKTYFTEDMYSGGHAAPCQMHRDIAVFADTPGVHLVCGPREHGKTVTAKKKTIHGILTGRIRIGGTLSHTMPTASNILVDLISLIEDNPRLMEDFGVVFIEKNKEQCALRTSAFKHTVHFAAFSEGRSVRGFSRQFGRPTYLLADDIETLASPLGEEHTKARVKMVAEAYRSLTGGGTILWCANNFDVRCATNTLKLAAEQHALPPGWHVHIYQAWTPSGPLWKAKFPATSESEMKVMVRATSEADFQGNDQQNPQPDDGERFPRGHYKEWVSLPEDVRGIVIVDPNLSLKEKGDTTAIAQLLYSPKEDCYYIGLGVRCKSYRASDTLLDDTLSMRDPSMIIAVVFDGNVNQEAQWTNNIRSWCQINKRPFPRVVYHRYNTDIIAKNAELVYAKGRLLFPPGMQSGEEGSRAMQQFFAWSGKKAGRKDDFPDIVICGIEALGEIGFAKPRQSSGTGGSWIISVTDTSQF